MSVLTVGVAFSCTGIRSTDVDLLQNGPGQITTEIRCSMETAVHCACSLTPHAYNYIHSNVFRNIGLDGPGIESRCGRDFPHPSRPALGPPSLLYNGYRVAFPGIKRPGCGFNHSNTPSAEVRRRVELYPYSPILAFTTYSRVNFTFTVYFYISTHTKIRKLFLTYIFLGAVDQKHLESSKMWWWRSVGPIMWEMEKCYWESVSRRILVISYVETAF